MGLGWLDIHLYRRFGEFVTDLFAMGFHRQQKLESETPFFLSETRKRIFAAVARRDKSLATYVGRPPLIHRLHCDITLPLDLDDADLILTGEELDSALRSVDQEGWNQATNSNERLRPATVIRLRYHTSILRERVLDISLGQRTENLKEDAWYVLVVTVLCSPKITVSKSNATSGSSSSTRSKSGVPFRLISVTIPHAGTGFPPLLASSALLYSLSISTVFSRYNVSFGEKIPASWQICARSV